MKITKKRKQEIFEAFLVEVRKIGLRQIKQGVDAGDPLAQVRACCNVLESAFKQQANRWN